MEASEVTQIESGEYANSPTGINEAEVWVRYRVRFTTANAGVAMYFVNYSFSNIGLLYRQADGSLTIEPAGGGQATTVATSSINTTYWVWARFKKGTGSNAEMEVWFSTTSTKPADGSNNNAEVTNGTGTTNVDFVQWQTNSATSYIDEVRVAAASIP
jgi:hypothetical protein